MDASCSDSYFWICSTRALELAFLAGRKHVEIIGKQITFWPTMITGVRIADPSETAGAVAAVTLPHPTFRCPVTGSHPLLERLSARLRSGCAEPISKLIVDDIWLAVVEGTLDSGERLPTVREIAVGLGVSPRTVNSAYRELEDRGVVATRAGEGTFISLAPPSAEERERHRRFGDLCRKTFEDASELGFTVDDLIDSLAEFRSIERPLRDQEKEP